MNNTMYKTLDRAANHPMVESIEQDSDGIWINLISGYGIEECISRRAETCADVWEDLKRIEPYAST